MCTRSLYQFIFFFRTILSVRSHGQREPEFSNVNVNVNKTRRRPCTERIQFGRDDTKKYVFPYTYQRFVRMENILMQNDEDVSAVYSDLVRFIHQKSRLPFGNSQYDKRNTLANRRMKGGYFVAGTIDETPIERKTRIENIGISDIKGTSRWSS